MVGKLKYDCGMWIENPQNIASKFIADYTKQFKSTQYSMRNLMYLRIQQVITDSKNADLIKLPDKEEVKKALFAINSAKTPGPDGFGAGFYKHYWDLINEDFYQCTVEFFTHGRLLKQLIHTFITLIPKTENPSQTHHFLPIILCSTVYKTISKSLVDRIRPLFDQIVSPVQSVFVLGHSIHDNILITHEIMHKFKILKGKTAWVALKFDMKKAYDRLEWDFIQVCLQNLGSMKHGLSGLWSVSPSSHI